MKRLVPVVLLLLGLATPAFADRLVVNDGTVLEGEIIDTGGEFIDVRVSETHFKRVRRADVARIESVLAPREIAAAQEGERLFVEAAAATDRPEVRARALAAFEKIEPALTEPMLLRRLAPSSGATEQRRLAAELLASHKGDAVVRALARSVVQDGISVVRSAALTSLRKAGNRETGLLFVEALKTHDPLERARATSALATFPRKEAVLALLLLPPPGGAGGGGGSSDNRTPRCHVAIITQSAYISGYQVVAGGTGLRVAEVAVPVVDVLETGCVLDVAVRYVTEFETFARGSVFSFLTGTHFDSDDKVAAWWKDAQKDFDLAPGAKKQLASLAEK
jgi:hypothetical protein